PPILHYDILAMEQEEFYQWAYDIMKAGLEIQLGNGLTRRLGYMDHVVWEPNKIPKRQGLKQPFNPLGPEVTLELLKTLRPPIGCFAFEMLAKGEGNDEAPVEAVIALMRKYGLDPDAEGLIDGTRHALLPFRETNKLAREKAAAKAAVQLA